MRTSAAAAFRLMMGIAAVCAAPAHGQTPADPGATHYADWVRVDLPRLGDTRLIPEVYWRGIVPDGPHLLAWVEWRHYPPEPVPGDTALFMFRIVRMRFDCAGRRYQPLGTLYYRRGDPSLVRVGASDTPGEWTAADTSLLDREMVDLACMPRDLGVHGELPLHLPASRWTEVFRRGRFSRQVDTAGVRHHGAYRLAWTRDVHEPQPRRLEGGVPGDTFNTRYALLRVDCATRRYREVRQALAYSEKVVDSVTRPGVPLVARDPTAADYAQINAVCGGPPTSLRAPGRPQTSWLAAYRPAPSPRRRRRGRKARPA